MIRFKLNGVTVCIDFSFFAVVTIMILCSDSVYAVYSMYACFLHEAGHLLMMMIVGQKVRKLVFYGAGIKIVPSRNCESEKFSHEVLVLAAGCGVNFVIALLSLVCEPLAVFGTVNLAVGLFNAMPLFFLDGGKIIIQCCYRFFDFNKSVKMEKTSKLVSVFLIVTIGIILYTVNVSNFTVYVTLFFLMITSLLM